MKASRYTNLIKKKDYYILHNPLYSTMLRVYSDELKDLIENINSEKDNMGLNATNFEGLDFYDTLVNLNMIVPDNQNEINILNYMFRARNMNKRTFSLIIIPTMQCNFRCPYCYEDHTNDSMKEPVYTGILKLLEDIGESKLYDKIIIYWFGGEPTLASKQIISFMNTLRDKIPEEISIISQMTTNGYLLSAETFNKFIDCGITEYQITLDGPKIFHDSTRFLVNNGGSWDAIINNLNKIKMHKGEFKIILRTNFTKKLFEHSDEWLRYLSENFGDDDRFVYHFETVKDLGGPDNSYAFKDSNEFDHVISMLSVKNNIKTEFSKAIYPFSLFCYASDPSNLVIDYDGIIKKCSASLYSEENIVGKIGEDGNLDINLNSIANWTSYEKNQKCYSCMIYPICFGLKCPSSYYNESYCESLISMYTSSIYNNY